MVETLTDDDTGFDPVECAQCEEMIYNEYECQSTYCGSIHIDCLSKHAKKCGACRKDFGGGGPDAPKSPGKRMLKGQTTKDRSRMFYLPYGVVIEKSGDAVSLSGSCLDRQFAGDDICRPDDAEGYVLVAGGEDIRSGKFVANIIESLLLAHASAGVDISNPKYLQGLETAIEAIANNID